MSASFSELLITLEAIKLQKEREAAEKGFESWEAMDAHDNDLRAKEAASRAENDRLASRARATAPLAGRLTERVRSAVISDGLDSTPALEAVRSWLRTDRPVLVLSGGTGTGKTVASAYAMTEFAGRVQFVRAVQVGAHWERWTSDRESRVAPLDLDVALLVVDDLGQEMLEDRRAQPALEEIFDSRQTMRTRTLVTTNMTKRQIVDRYSPRLISRLAQNGIVETLDGEDMRRRR